MRIAYRRTVLAILALAVIGLMMAGGAVAQNDTVFNGTNESAQDGWIDGDGDGSIDGIVGMGVRAVTYFIGGNAAQYGTVLSLVMGMMVIGTVGLNRAGVAAGSIAAVIGAYTFREAGLVEPWGYGIVLMIIGLLVASAYFRIRQ